MLATQEASNLIESFNFSEIDKVYTFNLPQEAQDSTDKTIVLITDTDTSLAFGNDDFYSKDREVELQIFYKLNPDFDPDELETKLLKYFIENNWTIADIRGHILDPDTKQLTFTAYIDNTQDLYI